ncbi:MAG: hypothetical protein ACRCRW_07525 [Aeromonadaceae bacterium]
MKLAYCLPLLLTLLTACAAPGETPSQQRSAIQTMRNETLAKLYKLKPEVRQEIRAAAGYAVFSNINNNLLFVSSGNGYGVTRDNRSGKDTYMKMASVGLGLGLGIKDFQAVILFKERTALTQFLEQGWDANVQADAAAKSGKKGAALSEAAHPDYQKIKVYQLTNAGLALQATVQGYKYWPDDTLNGRQPAPVTSVK